MNAFWYNLIKWSEVWGILIPLAIIIFYRIHGTSLWPVIIYVILATIINICANVISFLNYTGNKDWLPEFLQKNLFLYNIHSFLRVLLFGWYISNTSLLKKYVLFRLILFGYVGLTIINFIFLESFVNFSTNLFAAESSVLLTYCVLFFLFTIKDESDTIWMEHPAFIICTGVSLYEAISFFIFLFFDALAKENYAFSRITMQIFSVSYVIFCVLLTIALYRTQKQMKGIVNLNGNNE